MTIPDAVAASLGRGAGEDHDEDGSLALVRFLARLSGRRRHVRRPSRSRQSSGPGAAVAAASATVAATAAGRRRALEPPPSPSPPPLRSAPLAAATSVAMEPEREEELYRCARCRGERLCSCSHLGLVPADDEDDRQCRCEERGCDWEEEEDATTGTSRSSTRQRAHRRHACEDAARTTTYTWRRRAKGEDCGCAADRDVLRRRPPERAGGEGASGLPRPSTPRSRILPPYLATLLILSYSLVGVADACSSRSTPKPRPPTPTPRPNITFHMYACPPDYAEWYCLNGATCFTVKIVNSLLYNCLCANGYIGQRCEFKDLDGSYLPSRQRVMLETASIAGAVTIAAFLAVITFISVYVQCKRRQKELRTSTDVDAVDGMGRDPELRPFCSRSRSLMHFMAKNPNSSFQVTTQSIEKTRMPSWSHPAESSTRMTSVNETKRPPSQ